MVFLTALLICRSIRDKYHLASDKIWPYVDFEYPKATVKLNVDSEEKNFMFNDDDASFSDGIGNI